MIDLFGIETRCISLIQFKKQSPLARIPFQCPLLFRNRFLTSSSSSSSSSWSFESEGLVDYCCARGGRGMAAKFRWRWVVLHATHCTSKSGRTQVKQDSSGIEQTETQILLVLICKLYLLQKMQVHRLARSTAEQLRNLAAENACAPAGPRLWRACGMPPTEKCTLHWVLNYSWISHAGTILVPCWQWHVWILRIRGVGGYRYVESVARVKNLLKIVASALNKLNM